MRDDSATPLLTALRSNATLADLALLAAVPAVLLAVYALPAAAKRALVLDYQSPTPAAMYASHFVHFSLPHLASNLAAYLAAAPLAYAYCALAGRRTAFRVTFAVVLAAFPLALSALNAVFVRPSVSYGFSGVAAAFLGFLPLALAAYVGDRLLPEVTLDHAPLLFFLGAGTIAALTAPATDAGAVVLGIAGVGAAVYAASLWRAVGRREFRRAARSGGHAELAAVGVVVVLGFPFAAFPGSVAGDVVLNVYTHFLGYALGFVAPYATLRAAALIPN